MQSETPETDLHIQIVPALKADIEAVVAASGRTVNAWVVDVLADAVKRAQENAALRRSAEEKQRQLHDARADKALNDMMRKHRSHDRGSGGGLS
jgi:hypothetical protein